MQLRATSEDGGLPDASEQPGSEQNAISGDGCVNGANGANGVADAVADVVAAPSVQRWSRPQQLHEEVWANGSSIVSWLHTHVIAKNTCGETQPGPETGTGGPSNSQKSWYRCDGSFALARQLGALGLLSVVRPGSCSVPEEEDEDGRLYSNIAFTHSTFRVNVPQADGYDSDKSSDEEDQDGQVEQASKDHERARGQQEHGQEAQELAQGHDHGGSPGTGTGTGGVGAGVRARARSEGSKRHS